MKAPRVAVWLLDTLGTGPEIGSATGDLIEEYEAGRSRWWFWRQALLVIVLGFCRIVRARWPLCLRGVLTASALLWAWAIGMRLVMPRVHAVAASYLPSSPVERAVMHEVVQGTLEPRPWIPVSWHLAFYTPVLHLVALTLGAIAIGWCVATSHRAVRGPVVFLAAVTLTALALVQYPDLFGPCEYLFPAGRRVLWAFIDPVLLSMPVALFLGVWAGGRVAAGGPDDQPRHRLAAPVVSSTRQE